MVPRLAGMSDRPRLQTSWGLCLPPTSPSRPWFRPSSLVGSGIVRPPFTAPLLVAGPGGVHLGRKSSILGLWAALGSRETFQKGGGRSSPPFWKVSQPPGAAQSPKIDDLRPRCIAPGPATNRRALKGGLTIPDQGGTVMNRGVNRTLPATPDDCWWG